MWKAWTEVTNMAKIGVAGTSWKPYPGAPKRDASPVGNASVGKRRFLTGKKNKMWKTWTDVTTCGRNRCACPSEEWYSPHMRRPRKILDNGWAGNQDAHWSVSAGCWVLYCFFSNALPLLSAGVGGLRKPADMARLKCLLANVVRVWGSGGVWQKEPIIPEVFLDFVFDFQDEEGHAKVADFQLWR